MKKPKRKPQPKRKWLIKYYVKQGYSANKIQKELQKRKMGIRRQKLLEIVRKYKKKPKKPKAYKYIPKKYRKIKKPPVKPPVKVKPKKKLHRFEYTKYYRYTSYRNPSRSRLFECRLEMSLSHVHARLLWRDAENIMDSYMSDLGIAADQFTQTKAGIDYLGETTETRKFITVIDKHRGYKWQKWLI